MFAERMFCYFESENGEIRLVVNTAGRFLCQGKSLAELGLGNTKNDMET